MCVMTRQSVSDLHSPLFQVSNAHRMIAALTREMWVKAEVTKDLEIARENRNDIITSGECTKHEDMKEDNEYCVWKRKYVYFKCMTVFHSFPSIMNDDTVNMNLGTSKGSDLLNIVDEVLY